MEVRPLPRTSPRRTAILDGLVDLFLSEGFLEFSVEDLASRLQCSKSTLYVVARSKEQLITAVVREFFRVSTERVETRLVAQDEPLLRIRTYLDAIAAALAPASAEFYADVNDFAPAREIYLRNTAAAARRVQDLVTEATEPSSKVDAVFIGAVAATVMSAIQSGELEAMTSINDATAYRLLADLITAGVSGSGTRRSSDDDAPHSPAAPAGDQPSA